MITLRQSRGLACLLYFVLKAALCTPDFIIVTKQFGRFEIGHVAPDNTVQRAAAGRLQCAQRRQRNMVTKIPHDHPETGPATADSEATAIDTLSLLAVSGLWATYRQVERTHVAGRLNVSAKSSSAIRTTNDRPDALFQCSPALRYVYMLPGPPVPAALTASRAVLQAACLLPPVLLTGKHTPRHHAHLRDLLTPMEHFHVSTSVAHSPTEMLQYLGHCRSSWQGY